MLSARSSYSTEMFDFQAKNTLIFCAHFFDVHEIHQQEIFHESINHTNLLARSRYLKHMKMLVVFSKYLEIEKYLKNFFEDF